MSKLSLILSALTTIAFLLYMAPGIFAMNRGNVLRNLALWLAVFTALAAVYRFLETTGQMLR